MQLYDRRWSLERKQCKRVGFEYTQLTTNEIFIHENQQPKPKKKKKIQSESKMKTSRVIRCKQTSRSNRAISSKSSKTYLSGVGLVRHSEAEALDPGLSYLRSSSRKHPRSRDRPSPSRRLPSHQEHLVTPFLDLDRCIRQSQ